MHFATQKRGGSGIYFAAVLFLSTVVLGSFFQVGMNGYRPAMFRDMIDGTAHKPFVSRVLAPAVIRTVEMAVPDRIQVRIRDVASSRLVAELFKRYGWEQKDAVAYAVTAGLLYLCLLLFVHAFVILTRMQYNWPDVFVRMLSLTALAGLPCFFRYYSYLYDFPHLVLFCYALAALCGKNWFGYGVLFFLACLSKETAILLPMIFAIYYRKKWRSLFFQIGLLLQALIFVLVKGILFSTFKGNPGGSLEFHLGHNLTLQPYGFAELGMFIAAVLLCAWRWNEKPLFLRSAVWILLPLAGLTFWFGLLDEYRDYYEVYPVIMLLAAPAVANYLGIHSGDETTEKRLHNRARF